MTTLLADRFWQCDRDLADACLLHPFVRGLADGSLLLDGMMAFDELRVRLELPEPPHAGMYHTVGGLMLDLLGRVPREGDRILWGGWRFEVLDMDGRRVDKVLASEETSPVAG